MRKTVAFFMNLLYFGVFIAVQASVLNTTTSYNYDQVWLSVLDTQSIIFKVRACSDVHIGLAKYSGIANVDMYEIVLGGWENTQSVIRKGIQGGHEAELQQEGIVSCDESRYFWASWSGGLIAVGKGSSPNVKSTELMQWRDPQPHEVNAVGVTTASGYTGTWEFTQIEGRMIS